MVPIQRLLEMTTQDEQKLKGNISNAFAAAHTQNASDVALDLVPSSPEMKPGLAAVGSATVAVLSQSSGIERPLFCHEVGSLYRILEDFT